MKKISFSFKNHFLSRIYFYILAVLIIPSLVTYGVILKTNPKKEEIFTIFVDANINDEKEFKRFVKENTNIKNKEINVYSTLSSLQTYQVLYLTQGLESDILILSENGFDNSDSSYYLELTSGNTYYSDTNKMVNNKHYGIELYDGNNGAITSYVNYIKDVKYYIFINKKSIHTSSFSSSGKTEQIKNLLGAIYG